MAKPESKRPSVHAKYAWIGGHNEMIAKLREESDRAAAILGASFLESELRKRFMDFLVDDRSTQKLFEAYHPLSTFSALIDVAFGLGLLTRRMKTDLTYIRKIRNHFAHHPEHATFETAPVADWCRELTTAKGIRTQDGTLWREEGGRNQYLFALGTALTYFDRFVGASTRPKVPRFPLTR